MNLVQIIQQHVANFPPEQQAEVLDFVLFLEQKLPVPTQLLKTNQPSLLAVLAELPHLEESFPDIDNDLLPLDEVNFQ